MVRLTDRVKARHLGRRATPLLRRDPTAAKSLLAEATRLDPAFLAGWFDLGLLHKWSGSWEDALACNLRATELVGERADEPAWWNLGIAATALRRWDSPGRRGRPTGSTSPQARARSTATTATQPCASTWRSGRSSCGAGGWTRPASG